MKEKQEMCGRRDERVEKDNKLLWLDKNKTKFPIKDRKKTKENIQKGLWTR